MHYKPDHIFIKNEIYIFSHLFKKNPTKILDLKNGGYIIKGTDRLCKIVKLRMECCEQIL